MRVSRLYVEASLQPGTSLPLPPEASHYLATVLRLSTGSTLTVFNGEDGEFAATIDSVSKKQVLVSLGDQLSPPEPQRLQIHLAVGLSKGERMDFVMQKATELGVTRITPLYCQFGEVRFREQKRLDNKLRHWRQIIINACEQCGRISLPDLQSPQALGDWLSAEVAGPKLLLHTGDAPSITAQAVTGSVALLSGPEGGFSEPEVNAAQQAGYQPISLGPRILRTETAPVAALAILQALHGDI